MATTTTTTTLSTTTMSTTPMSTTRSDAFQSRVRASNAACESGDFELAVQLYSEALEMDRSNAILFSNRSAALIKLRRFHDALHDANRAKQLSPEWPKASYRQGVALQCLGRHCDALVAFAHGLALDPKSAQLMAGLVEAAIKSPLKGSLEPTYRQLQAMRLDRSPFVVISVVGQELLASGHYRSACQVLESALAIGTCSLKLRGSVFSALSSANWALNYTPKALAYMQQDLVVAKQLNDVGGECRVQGNLGSAHFRLGDMRSAITAHRTQLVLAMKCKDDEAAANALSSLGHVYAAAGDLNNAMQSHQQCLELLRRQSKKVELQHAHEAEAQLEVHHDDEWQDMESRELGHIGHVYRAKNDIASALKCHNEQLELALRLKNRMEEARARSSLGLCHQQLRHYEEALVQHHQVLRLAQDLNEPEMQGKAYAGMGLAARELGHLTKAKSWHEKQLEMALFTRDKSAESRACSDLGIVYQMSGDFDAALKLHQAHLNLATKTNDKAGVGRAQSNIGNAYVALNQHTLAIECHRQHLLIVRELGDRRSEALVQSNLGAAHQAGGMHEMALMHFHKGLNLCRENNELHDEMKALANLANCHAANDEFAQAVPFYESSLELSRSLSDVGSESELSHNLGYAHQCLHDYSEALKHYERDLTLCHSSQSVDPERLARVYCNLGHVHKALGNIERALQCQKLFLGLSERHHSSTNRSLALGNVGELLLHQGHFKEALKCFSEQIQGASDTAMEARAQAMMALTHCQLQEWDQALSHYTQELSLWQDLRQPVQECGTLANVGLVHLQLKQTTQAIKTFNEELECARTLIDNTDLEAKAEGHLGVAFVQLRRWEEARAHLQRQLTLLQERRAINNESINQLASNDTSREVEEDDVAECRRHLGHCLLRMGHRELALSHLQFHLKHVLLKERSEEAQDALGQVGQVLQSLKRHREALLCFEKLLVLVHDDDPLLRESVYSNLFSVHMSLRNYEQAMSCLQHQMKSPTNDDVGREALLASRMGDVYLRMGDFSKALEYHRLDLKLSDDQNDSRSRSRLRLAETYVAKQELAPALRLASEAVQLSRESEKLEDLFVSLTLLGSIYSTMNEINMAEQVWKEASTMVNESLTHLNDQMKADLHLKQALHYKGVGDLEQSLSEYRSASALLDIESLEMDECLSEVELIEMRLERPREALLTAERRRLLKLGLNAAKSSAHACDVCSLVHRQKSTLLVCSVVRKRTLNLWMLMPAKGIVKVHQVDLSHNEDNTKDRVIDKDDDLFGSLAPMLREAQVALLDVANDPVQASADCNEDEINDDEMIEGQLLRRDSRLNASSHSLSSMFSKCNSIATRTAATSVRSVSRHRRSIEWPWLSHLHHLLLQPMEDEMPEENEDLTLVLLDDALYKVPFALLRASVEDEMLGQRYNLMTLPNLSLLRNRNARSIRDANNLVCKFFADSKGEHNISNLSNIAAVLNVENVNHELTKHQLMKALRESDLVHLSATLTESGLSIEEGEEVTTLVAQDLLITRPIKAKIVILHLSKKNDRSSDFSDSAMSLAKSILVAGAQCVLINLWPVSHQTSELVLKAFYGELVQGTRLSKALAIAQQTLYCSKQLSHPKHWGGFVLVGCDNRLISKVALLSQALRQVLETPATCRDALRVCLHLVEKSLQRLQRQARTAMFTSESSIERKVGPRVEGWQQLLMSVGFRFESGSSGRNVFFPQSDPGERLTQASASLQALLGVNSVHLWTCLRDIVAESDKSQASDQVIALFRHLVFMYEDKSHTEDITVSTWLWQTKGLHELLSALHVELVEAGGEEVRLRTPKIPLDTSVRQTKLVLQSLVALLDSEEAARCVTVLQDDDEDNDGDNEKEVANVTTGLELVNEKVVSSPQGDTLEYEETGANVGVVVDGGDDDDAHDARLVHDALARAHHRVSGQRVPPPPPMPRFTAELSAFSTYVRRRGEPDGRQASNADSPPNTAHALLFRSVSTTTKSPLTTTKTMTTRRSGRRESDDNFTPSPVHTVDVVSGPVLTDGDFSSSRPVGRPLLPVRSVFTEAGRHVMVNTKRSGDKLSVRTNVVANPVEMEKRDMDEMDARLKPGVSRRMPPTGESDDSPDNTLTTSTATRLDTAPTLSSIILSEGRTEETCNNSDTMQSQPTPLRPRQWAKYLNERFAQTSTDKSRNMNTAIAASQRENNWRRDENGTLRYTGNLASDC